MMSPALDEQETNSRSELLDADQFRGATLWVIAALTALYVIVVAIGNRRYVWFDELFTYRFRPIGVFRALWYRVQ